MGAIQKVCVLLTLLGLLAACSPPPGPLPDQTTQPTVQPMDTAHPPTAAPPTTTQTSIPVPTQTALPTSTPTPPSPYVGSTPPGAVLRFGLGAINSFSYSPDGQFLLVSSRIMVALYQADTLERVWYREIDHSGGWFHAAFSPDGTMVAVDGGRPSSSPWGDARILLLDAATGNTVKTFMTKALDNLVFSPDGTTLAMVTEEDAIRYLDLETGAVRESISANLENRFTSLQGFSFSPDGSTLAMSTREYTVIWDAAALTIQARLDWGSRFLTYSPDGGRLAVGNRVVDTTTGDILAESGNTFVFAPVGADPYVIVGGVLQRVSETTGEPLVVFTGHRAWVKQLAFSADGGQVVTLSGNDELFLWDTQTGERLGFLPGHLDPIADLAFSPDGRLVAAGHWYHDGIWDSPVTVWDIETGDLLHILEGHQNTSSAVAFSPDGKILASGSWDGQLILWDPQTGRKLQVVEVFNSWIIDLVFSPDGSFLAASVTDNTIVLWETATWETAAVFPAEDTWTTTLAFSPDGKVLAGTDAGALVLWDVVTGEQLQNARVQGEHLLHPAFSPDGRVVATTTHREIILWNAVTGEVLQTFSAGSWGYQGLTYSPDGRILVSCSEGGPRLVLSAAGSGSTLAKLDGHHSMVTSCVFSPDGTLLGTGSVGGTIILWNVASLE